MTPLADAKPLPYREALARAHRERVARMRGCGKPSSETEIIPSVRHRRQRFAAQADVAVSTVEAAVVADAVAETIVPTPSPVVPGPVLPLRSYPSVRTIVRDVSMFYGVPEREIMTSDRLGHIVRARQIAMYLARTLTPYSLHDVGRRLGRDHSTVVHAMDRIRALLERNAKLAAEIAEMTAILRAGCTPPPSPVATVDAQV